MMKKALGVILLAAIGAGSAEAKQTALRVSDRGLLGAMKRMGCSKHWLSVVMRKSSIAESDLRRLPVGRRVTAPDACASEPPSREERRASIRILINDSARTQVARLEEENHSLAKKAAAEKRAREDAEAQMKKTADRARALEGELTALKGRRLAPFWAMLFILLLAGAVAGAAWFFWYSRILPKNVEMHPRTVVYRHEGQPVRFALVSEPRHYKCPLCSAQDIEDRHLARHLKRVHSLAPDPDDTVKTA